MKILLICISGISALFYSSLDPPSVVMQGFKIPIVIDTFIGKQEIIKNDWRRTANYHPLFMGSNRDSVFVCNTWPGFDKYYVYGNTKDLYQRPDSTGLLLLVDTTQVISSYWRDWSVKDSELKVFKAYPVILVNIGNVTLKIGHGFHLPLIMEALDSKGKWRPIEEQFMYKCGTGMNNIILPANEIVVTSALINDGTYKTRLRLRFNHIFSREFSGTIHLTQFESGPERNRR